MPNFTSSGDIEKLRQLLFEEDQEKIRQLQEEIDRLRQQISDKEALIETLDPVLGDAISRRIGQAKDEMAEALAPVMGAAIKTQIANAKEDIVDALYPVIGATIRKSIAEAMRNLARTVNEQVERALSFRIWWQRIKSKITGVPQDQLILKEALPFTIHNILFIHQETGILLADYTPGEDTIEGVNQELVGGMLTAITDFARSISDSSGTHELREIQYEDMTIFLEMGRYAWLAVVTSGAEPDHFRTQVARTENQLHNRFYKELRDFSGDTSVFAPVRELLKQLYNRVMHPADLPAGEAAEQSQSQAGLKLILAVGLILLAFLAWRNLPDYLAERSLRNALQEHLVATGKAGEAEVDIRVKGAEILVSGVVADRAQQAEIIDFLSGQRGERLLIDHLRLAGPAVSLAQVREAAMQRLAGATDIDPAALQFRIDGDMLTISGVVKNQEQRLLVASMLAETLPFRVIINDLDITDPLQEMLPVQIFFPRGSVTPTAADSSALRELVDLLKGTDFTAIRISGYSDASGTPASQERTARLRAQRTRALLVALGLPGEKIKIRAFAATDAARQDRSEKVQAFNRRVEIEVIK